MSKRKSKKKSQEKHFLNRSLQRVGIALDHKALVEKIQKGELPFVYRQSNRVTLFRIEVDNIPYNIVYDKLRKQIITILYASEDNILSQLNFHTNMY